jgi:hypothetical protein
MNNHYHLLIDTPAPNLTRGMQRLNQVYTQRINRRHRQVGHVLQGRHKAIVVDAACRRFVAQGIGRPSVWEHLRGQMWLVDELLRAKMQRRLGARPPPVSRNLPDVELVG